MPVISSTVQPADDYSAMHHVLHAWYRQHGRHHLPWRVTDDPYAVYISEVMLQQTQVRTVLERYYAPFLSTFPTLQALANAPQDAVLKAWEGLGYYSRARNLQRAAQMTAPDYRLPDDVEALKALPGIGQNTAHAVAAFAFHKPVPVMEANVARVLARFFALKTPTAAELWQKAWALLDMDAAFDYNQAMMDIGAMVCTRRAPLCEECPLAASCKGKDDPESYPAPKQKKATPTRTRTIYVITQADTCFYVVPRKGRFLAGLYGFVEHDRTHPVPPSARLMGAVEQVYSHFKLDAHVYYLDAEEAGNSLIDAEVQEGGVWLNMQELWALPMSRADHKVLRLLELPLTARPMVAADREPENH